VTKIIKLKEVEISLLKENANLNIISKFIDASHYDGKSKSWIFLLTVTDIEIIADELFNMLQSKGITDGEINGFGKLVDNLIDKFNYYE
jgi:hypothetical protein